MGKHFCNYLTGADTIVLNNLKTMSSQMDLLRTFDESRKEFETSGMEKIGGLNFCFVI